MRQLKISKKITTRDQDSLDKYLSEISRLDMISADQEVELARRIKEGDQIALQKLAKANLRFVVSVAKQYQNNGVTLNDLISEGNLGLIRASSKFDETRGFKFISYAVWWIRQAIMQAIVEQSRIIRLPVSKIGAYTKITKAFRSFEQEYQREPEVEELMEMLGMTKDEIDEYFRVNTFTLSTDSKVAGVDEGTLKDVLYDKEAPTAEDRVMEDTVKT